MATLDIRPHSPQVSGYAIAGLMLVGAAAFAAGLLHQIAPTNGPAPFPPAQFASYRAPQAAAPPVEQVALRGAPAPETPVAAARPQTVPPVIDPPPKSDAAVAVDASASAPDQAAPPPEPQPPADTAPQA